MYLDMPYVVILEVTVPALMKVDHDGHYLAGRQLARSSSALQSATELFSMPVRCEPFVKIINMAEKWEQTHLGYLLGFCVLRRITLL